MGIESSKHKSLFFWSVIFMGCYASFKFSRHFSNGAIIARSARDTINVNQSSHERNFILCYSEQTAKHPYFSFENNDVFLFQCIDVYESELLQTNAV